MFFSVKICPPCRIGGVPKTANLLFGGRVVASAPFTYWGGIGKITAYPAADFLAPHQRRKMPSFLREWGKSVVMARLDYAKDTAELNKES